MTADSVNHHTLANPERDFRCPSNPSNAAKHLRVFFEINEPEGARNSTAEAMTSFRRQRNEFPMELMTKKFRCNCSL
jgi:uncharacterized Zn-finger protein